MKDQFAKYQHDDPGWAVPEDALPEERVLGGLGFPDETAEVCARVRPAILAAAPAKPKVLRNLFFVALATAACLLMVVGPRMQLDVGMNGSGPVASGTPLPDSRDVFWAMESCDVRLAGIESGIARLKDAAIWDDGPRSDRGRFWKRARQ